MFPMRTKSLPVIQIQPEYYFQATSQANQKGSSMSLASTSLKLAVHDRYGIPFPGPNQLAHQLTSSHNYWYARTMAVARSSCFVTSSTLRSFFSGFLSFVKISGNDSKSSRA